MEMAASTNSEPERMEWLWLALAWQALQRLHDSETIQQDTSSRSDLMRQAGLRRGVTMARYFFGLCGGQNLDDPGGLAFEHELDAFRAAERLAAELSCIRPQLQGSTCVIVTSDASDSTYCVSIGSADSDATTAAPS